LLAYFLPQMSHDQAFKPSCTTWRAILKTIFEQKNSRLRHGGTQLSSRRQKSSRQQKRLRLASSSSSFMDRRKSHA
jgi:hypothetical protein